MNKRTALAAAMTLILGLGSVSLGSLAHAQGMERHDRGHGEERRDHRRDDWRDNRRSDRADERRHQDYRGQRDYRHHGYGRGAGPQHSFYRGDRLPREYRHRAYVVDDWRGYRLSAPPRGYHWVQVGADYVLVAVATGIITQILLGN